MSNQFDQSHEVVHESPKSHTRAFALLGFGLAAALIGDGYLLVRSNNLSDQIASTKDDANAQISKLNKATTTLLQQQHDRIAAELSEQVKGVNDSAAIAIKKARSEALKQNQELTEKLAQQQQEVAGQLTDIQTSTSSKFSEVATDVDGVKQNVETVKANVAQTQSELEKTGADLKRVMGDMGVMSGLVATNSKDLEALRTLGERNYFEFTLNKGQTSKKVADIILTLKKADMKHNRFTMDVFADDKHIEKKDRGINEPVQIYVGGMMQPYEIVVNQVSKDQIVGYLATPKVKLARR